MQCQVSEKIVGKIKKWISQLFLYIYPINIYKTKKKIYINIFKESFSDKLNKKITGTIFF